MNFVDILFLALATFLLSTSLLYWLARKSKDDSAAMCAVYDLFWVLLSLGSLLLLSLTAGSQRLRGLEFDAELQREHESYVYRSLLLEVPLSNVCSEPLVLKPNETKESAFKARDEACLWAKNSTSMARKLQFQITEVDASCVSDDDLRTFVRPLSQNTFPVCGFSRVNPCARAICERDKTLQMIASQRFIKPMPTRFDSSVFREFNDKLSFSAPKEKLDRSTYKALRPIETGVFALMWVWTFAVGFGFRLAKGVFEVHMRCREARKSTSSWFRIQPMNWKPWKGRNS